MTKSMTMTMTKADIVNNIYAETDWTRSQVKSAVENLLSVMKGAVKRDKALLVSGFGKFKSYKKNPRKGRNPATNETIVLEGRQVVVFRVSKKFREDLN